MTEHPTEQEIESIAWTGPEGVTYFRMGEGVTRIDVAYKDGGEYVSIPYIRVWNGDQCLAEFCQHKIIGVFFKVTA